MTSQSRLRVIMSIASVGALVLAGGLFCYLYYQSGAFADRAVAARDALLNQETITEERKDLRSIADATAPLRSELPEHFVPTDNAVAFIQALEAVGPSSGATITISSITANNLDSAAPGTIGTISASVSGSGSWGGVMRALELIETLPYKSSVSRVSLSTSEPGGSKAQSARYWQLSLDISASTLAPIK